MPLRLGIDAFNLDADRRGMGRYVRAMLRGLAANECEIALIVRDAARAQPVAAEFPFRVLPLREAKRERFDVMWYPWNGVRFRTSGRTVVTMYDAFAFTHAHRDLVARWREQAPIRRAARGADALVTISHWSAGELARALHVDAARFNVIAPVPDAFWQPGEAIARALPYVLVVGGPDERKNLPLLFTAFERAFSDGSVELVIAGTLREADETLLRCAAFAYERIHPGDDELRTLYRGALAVAVPSQAEGYGLMAAEAMCCGAPVLAADAAALPEACDGAAWLLPPTDVQRWSETLREIATNGARRDELHRRSLERAARFDRSAPVSAFRALLQRVAAGAP